MFDIGFFELLIVAIVGLVVIGPERLPETVRSVSLWIGRFKRSLRETRSELERQIGADDIRRQLHNEDVMQSLEKTRREIEQAIASVTHEPVVPSAHLPDETNKPATKLATSSSNNAANYAPEVELPDHAHLSDSTSDQTQLTDTQPQTSDLPSSSANDPTTDKI